MKCKICGGVEFTKEDCYYYCNECQTRCEELVERVIEDDYADKDKFEFKTNILSKNTKAEDVYQWTTWEAYNYILKGMVDEVIKLGATPKLKVTVLQLWVRYLQIIKAAFLPQGLLPKLGPLFNPRDAKVVYSISERRSVKRKRYSVSSFEGSDRLSFSKSKGRAKKMLAKSVLSRSEASSIASSSASECSFTSSRSTRMSKYMTREGFEYNKKKKAVGSTGGYQDTTSVAKISRLKLLGILHLGLLLSKDKIQLSDLLRWIREGHLSYYYVIHLLPANMTLNGRDRLSFGSRSNTPSYSMVRKIAGKLAPELGIESIPLPDFPSLIYRYIKELELPEEMSKFAVNLWSAYPPKMQIKGEKKTEDELGIFAVNCQAVDSPKKQIDKVGKSGLKELPNYEARAMAIIIYSMKLIFGLDGYTELKLSQFARKANKVLSLDHSHSKFFVWGDWVKYIEFRNRLVEKFYFPSSYTDEPEQIHLFRDLYSTVPPLPPSQKFYKCAKFLENFSELNGLSDKKSKADWRKFMERELDEMIGNGAQLPFEKSHLNFEPSITPYLSYFKQLHDNKVLRKSWSQNVNGVPCEELFKASFDGTSLAYVLNPMSCVQDLNEKGVSVTVKEGSACTVNDVKFVEPVQSVRETNSAIHNTKKKSMEVVLTSDRVNSSKKIRWFARIDKAKLFENINTKKKVSSSVEVGGDFLHSPKNNNRGQSIKKRDKPKQYHQKKKKTSTEKLTLHLPHRKVWMFYGTFCDLTEIQFYYLAQRFPSSFQWLLNLCAKNLEVSEVSLYSELVDVELVHKSNLTSTSKKINGPETSYENRRITLARSNW